MTPARIAEILEHMNHVVAQRAKNQPTHHLDIRLVGPGMSIDMLEVAELRELLESRLTTTH